MLVLSRKVGQKIQIGDDITLCVTRIASNRVSLAVQAPCGIHILRDELYRKKPESTPPGHEEGDIPATD